MSPEQDHEKPEGEKTFSASLYARRATDDGGWEMQHQAATVYADTPEDAMRDAHLFALKLYPTKDGWAYHSASVLEVTGELERWNPAELGINLDTVDKC